MNITTVNLSDGQLAELRKLGVENVSALMRTLTQQYIKRLRGSKKTFLRKKDACRERLLKAEVKWFEIELVRARAAKDEKAIKFYEGKLA